MLPLLLMGESVAFELALGSGQTAAESPVWLLPPLAVELLSWRVGGEDVHLALLAFFALRSALLEQGSGVKLLDIKLERSGLGSVLFVPCDEAAGGCALQLHSSGLMVRGSGFTILQTGSVVPRPPLDSSSMASELKITLKCVFSEGVMVKVFGSHFSFLLT